ncbi:tyrosine-type recombinase/integrase [Jiella pelagia]|uniref:Site-specific integrase n=1 Tax=Jiella pelagia TaxID=2986949 RepID=A0ABY7BXG1_9HYPH|nr:site-specific integrase [Jiella pelagia]WAP67198.1 site-specific integrase [Jiella pelagia]
MSVYRPKDRDGNFKTPYFHFDFTVRIHGERRRFHGSTGERTVRAAEAAEAKERRRVLRSGPNDDLTLTEAIERYAREVLAEKPGGLDTVIGLQHCERLIGGDRRLANITANDIAEAVLRRAAETHGKKNPKLVSGATVNRNIIEPMRAVMTRAARVWGVGCEPHKIDWPKLRRREAAPRERELTDEEAAAFWRELREDFHPFTAFLLGRGLRLNAALGLKKLDVDLPRHRIRVWIKGKGLRWTPISDADAALIEGEMKKSPLPEVWTYEVQRGREKGMRRPLTLTGYRRSQETALKNAGVTDFRRHDMRHDFATKLLRATRDIALVQKALAHSSITSTMRYAHVLDEDLFEGLNAKSRNSPGTGARKAQ